MNIRQTFQRVLTFLRWMSAFILLAGWVAKILLLAHAPTGWRESGDNVTGFSNVRTAELALLLDAIGVALIICGSDKMRSTVLVCIGSIFILYHGISAAIGKPMLCPCLAGLTRLFGLSSHTSGVLSIYGSVFLLLSGALMAANEIARRRLLSVSANSCKRQV